VKIAVDDIQRRIKKTESELASIRERIPQLKIEKDEKLLNCEDVATLNMEIRELEQKHKDLSVVLPKLQEKLKEKELETRAAEIAKEATELKKSLQQHIHKIEKLRNATKKEYVNYKKVRGRLVHVRAEIDKMKAQGVDVLYISIPSIQNELNIEYFANNKGLFLRQTW